MVGFKTSRHCIIQIPIIMGNCFSLNIDKETYPMWDAELGCKSNLPPISFSNASQQSWYKPEIVHLWVTPYKLDHIFLFQKVNHPWNLILNNSISLMQGPKCVKPAVYRISNIFSLLLVKLCKPNFSTVRARTFILNSIKYLSVFQPVLQYFLWFVSAMSDTGSSPKLCFIILLENQILSWSVIGLIWVAF